MFVSNSGSDAQVLTAEDLSVAGRRERQVGGPTRTEVAANVARRITELLTEWGEENHARFLIEAGITRQTAYRVLNPRNESALKVEDLWRVANALHTSIDFLVGRETERDDMLSPFQRRVIDSLRNPRIRATIETLLPPTTADE